MKNQDFFTFSEYMKKDNNPLTASMEDYMEMIYRLSRENGFTRINELSNALNVQPPSATKMVQKLAELGMVNYQKYGVILLTEYGKQIGEALLNRHNIIEEFLKLLGVSDSTLEVTEKIEHILNQETLKCISNWVGFLKGNPEIQYKYNSYK